MSSFAGPAGVDANETHRELEITTLLFVLLEQACDDCNGYDIVFIETDHPLLNPLRGEPRIQALVAKVFASMHGKSSP